MNNLNLAVKPEELLAPIVALNELAVANVESLIGLQVEGLNKYSGIAIKNWKEGLKVKDVAGAQKFLAKQSEIAKSVIDSLVADAKVVGELGQSYVSDVQKLVNDNVTKAAKKAA